MISKTTGTQENCGDLNFGKRKLFVGSTDHQSGKLKIRCSAQTYCLRARDRAETQGMRRSWRSATPGHPEVYEVRINGIIGSKDIQQSNQR